MLRLGRDSMPRAAAQVLLVLALLACREPPSPDCDGLCEPFGPEFPGVGECKQGECTPTFGECFGRDEHATCAEACAAQGSICVENGCAGNTYLLIATLEWCLDPEKVGVAVEHGCEEEIDWQFTYAGQCCCEHPEDVPYGLMLARGERDP